MSIINCQIGQCGNQLGSSILSKLAKEASEGSLNHQLTTLDTFFNPTAQTDEGLYAKSILIDMEPKVIENLLTK